MAHNVDLSSLFMNLQKEMKAKLETGRACVDHPGEKGDDSEVRWIEWFVNYLPKRYDAKKAFVLDSRGALSNQIDVVIFDRQYSPFLLHRDRACYVPAESVYAVLEIKQSLNRAHVKYAMEKIRSVRALHRTSARIPHAGGVYKPKRSNPILSGILTYDCDWAKPFGKPLKQSLLTDNPEERIDLGCSICDGAFEARYGKKGTVTLETSGEKGALIFFFLKLLTRLQEQGTVAAIDLRQYMKAGLRE